MAANELGGRVDNDITTMLERLHEVWGRECVIQDEWNAIFMRNICYSLDIQGIEAWITYCFGENRLCALINSGTEILRVAAVDKSDSNTKLGECIVEQVIGATIETGRANDFVACLSDVEYSQCFC